MSVSKTRPVVAEPVSTDVTPDDAHVPRPLTFVQNVVLTLKVLAGLGVLGAALWAANLWTAAE